MVSISGTVRNVMLLEQESVLNRSGQLSHTTMASDQRCISGVRLRWQGAALYWALRDWKAQRHGSRLELALQELRLCTALTLTEMVR